MTYVFFITLARSGSMYLQPVTCVVVDRFTGTIKYRKTAATVP